MLFVANDHARIGLSDVYPAETMDRATQLHNAHAYCRLLGVTFKSVRTDNSTFRSNDLRLPCRSDLPVPIGRRLTSRQSASSSRRCASGLMRSTTNTRHSAPIPWMP